MRRLLVRLTRRPDDSRPVGTLAEDRGHVYFEYDREYLADGWDLSPLSLPFAPGLFEHTDRQFGPLPGLFDDSLPDGWGLLLMDRHFRSLGMDPREVSPLHRLAWLGTRTMGALTYHPPLQRKDADAPVFDLHDLARQSQEVLGGQAADVLPQLLNAGGSPGGARPKVLVGVGQGSEAIRSGEDDLPEGYEHWIVKFAARNDPPDAGPLEYAYARMAAAAGIDMPPTRLFLTSQGDRFFGAKRFDREGNRRLHVHTFGNLIQSNFRIPSADYADLLRATAVLTRNHHDVRRAFRMMTFNVLAHNRDDHVKNFAFLLDDRTGEWSLSPAYDLCFTAGPGGEHSMTVDGQGRQPQRADMLRLAAPAGLAAADADAILAEVRAAVGRWMDFAQEVGVSQQTAELVRRSLPGVE